MFSRYLAAGSLLLGGSLFGVLQPVANGQDANRAEVYTRRDVGDIVQSVARRTASFKGQFNSAVAHSLIDGTKLEDRAKRRADDLEDSARKLRDVYGDKRDKNNPAVRDQVDKTLAAASDVNRVMTEHRFTDKVQREWNLLRSDLNGLADVYNLPPL
jgi:hypothetical protein